MCESKGQALQLVQLEHVVIIAIAPAAASAALGFMAAAVFIVFSEIARVLLLSVFIDSSHRLL